MNSANFFRAKAIALAVAATAAFTATSSQAGVVFNEVAAVGDAGESIAGAAATVGGPLDAIRGILNPTLDVVPGNDYADAFKIFLTAGDTFGATTTASAFPFNALDTVLYLFDDLGAQVAFNDDDIGSQSTISYAVASTGYYYIAITGFGYAPGASLNAPWVGETSEGGAYEILLTGASSGPAAAVPEPASLALVGLALGAVGLSRRRRAAAAQA